MCEEGGENKFVSGVVGAGTPRNSINAGPKIHHRSVNLLQHLDKYRQQLPASDSRRGHALHSSIL